MINMFFVKMVIATLMGADKPYAWNYNRYIQFTNNGYQVVVDMQDNTLRVHGGGLTLRHIDHDNVDSLIVTLKDMFANPNHWRYN